MFHLFISSPKQGYKFPFSVVIYHLFVKLVMSTLIRIFYRIFTGKNRVKLNFATAVKKVAPTSFFGAIDIGFSQWGLEFVKVTLYTMTKSTVIIFISFFAVMFRLEKKVSVKGQDHRTKVDLFFFWWTYKYLQNISKYILKNCLFFSELKYLNIFFIIFF